MTDNVCGDDVVCNPGGRGYTCGDVGTVSIVQALHGVVVVVAKKSSDDRWKSIDGYYLRLMRALLANIPEPDPLDGSATQQGLSVHSSLPTTDQQLMCQPSSVALFRRHAANLCCRVSRNLR